MANSDNLRVTVLDVIPPEGLARWRKVGDTQDRVALMSDGSINTGGGSVAPTPYTPGAEVFYAAKTTSSAVGVVPGVSGTIPAGQRPVVVKFRSHITSTVAGDVTQLSLKVDGVVANTIFVTIKEDSGYRWASGECRLAASASARVITMETSLFFGTGTVSAPADATYPTVLAAQYI